MGRDEIRLWRDAVLGEDGTELLAGHCTDHRYRPHFHDEVVIAAFTRGAQRHRVGRHQGVAGPGHVLIIPAGETHTGEAERDDGWSYRAFYPDRKTLARVAGALFHREPVTAPDFDLTPLHHDHALARRLTWLHGIIEASTCEPLARQQAFSAAMAAVLQRYARNSFTPVRARPEYRKIRRAVDLARTRFSDPGLRVDDLAAAAGMSPYHFMRSFRATLGVTAHGFVVQLRLAEAKRLLSRGHAAAGVAGAVGFTDQSHLIRRFRAAMGLTPGQFAQASLSRGAA